MQTALTSYSIAIGARVVRQFGALVKGHNAQADAAFDIVASVMEEYLRLNKLDKKKA